MGHIGDPHRVLVVHRIQTGPLTGFLLQRVNPDGQLGRSVGVLSASASSSARRRFWRSEVRSRSLRARYWTRVGSRDEVKQRPKPHVNLSRRVPMSERLAFRPTEAGRVTPMDNRPLPTEVPERGTHLHGDLPMRGDVIVRANPRAVPRVDDGWRSARVGVRTGWPPGVVLPDLVAVVAHGRVATSQLQQQLFGASTGRSPRHRRRLARCGGGGRCHVRGNVSARWGCRGSEPGGRPRRNGVGPQSRAGTQCTGGGHGRFGRRPRRPDGASRCTRAHWWDWQT